MRLPKLRWTDNEVYGHGSIIRAYCDVLPWLHIPVHIQHGWNAFSGYTLAGRELISPRSPRVVWGERQLAYSRERGLNVKAAIGAPFLYLTHLRLPAHVKRDSDARVPLVFPYHGTAKDPVTYTHAELARSLTAEFGWTTVCLHVNEFQDDSVVRAYVREGHRVVTAGPMHSSIFLVNQLQMIDDASEVIVNRLSTAAFYAGHRRKRVRVWGQRPVIAGEEGRSQPRDVLDIEARLATEVGDTLEWFADLSDKELGLPYTLDPNGLRETLQLTSNWIRPASNALSMATDVKNRLAWKAAKAGQHNS